MNIRSKLASMMIAASVTLLVPAVQPAAVAADDGGTIAGTISVSGVKNAENVVVYVEKVDGDWEPTKNAHVDQFKLVFDPHVLPVVVGSEVAFKNSDPILHNIFWPKGKGYSARNLGTWGKGAEKKYKFDKIGHVVLLCNVHPEMEGHILILQNPFFTVVDKDGEYKIEGVPPGEYTVKTWYSKPKKLRSKSAKVTVKAGETTTQDFSLSRRR